jgi:hypothetical protein
MTDLTSENYEKNTRCQSIYRNLLISKSLPTSPCACVYFRELEYTSKCDEYYNFSRIRESYKELVGADAAERIRKFHETEEDERRAEQAVSHYNDWTVCNLKSALSWQNLLWYHSVHRGERTIAMVTMAGAAFGGWRFVRNFEQKWRQQKQ